MTRADIVIITKQVPVLSALAASIVYNGVTTIQKKYENKIVMDADALFKADQHDEAANLVADALKIVPDSILLAQKKIEIEHKKSKLFTGILTPYEDRHYSAVVNGQIMEMGGSKYSNGFTMGGSYWDSAYALFNLDGQYTKIKGVIGHIDKSGNSDTSFSIFADDVLIDTIEIGWQQLPKEFSIDVTGVKQLKFERSAGETVTGIAELMIN